MNVEKTDSKQHRNNHAELGAVSKAIHTVTRKAVSCELIHVEAWSQVIYEES